jgi:deoxyribonuclease-4
MNASDIRFGPSGISAPLSAKGYTRTVDQPAALSDMGLSAFEYSFGRGVRISEKTAGEIGAAFYRHGIALSVHAPYYINLASDEQGRDERNLRHFVKTAEACVAMGAARMVFHPGSVGKGERAEAFMRVFAALPAVVRALDELGFSNITLCPETMGKINQIGDLDETIALCTLDERLIPCLDFGHLYARSLGRFATEADYLAAFDKIESALGVERARRLHIHFSRIEFTQGGEKRHHNEEDTQYGPSFVPLARALIKKEYAPVIICESKSHMAEDAQAYMHLYHSLKGEKNL